MAAAPELLEALKNLLATAEFVDAGNKRDGAERYSFAKSLFEQSRAAIAKATTEPTKP
jgi:site-specific recombinase